jgi:hypothetical protein
MSEHISGKTFYSSPEEAGVERLTPEEIAGYLRLAEDFETEADAIPPEELRPLGPRFYDDISGTEFDPEWQPE